MDIIGKFWGLVEEAGESAVELWALDYAATLPYDEKAALAVGIVDGPDGIADALDDVGLAGLLAHVEESRELVRAEREAEFFGELEAVAA